MERPSFGDHLRRWRQRRRLSQLQLAEVAEVSSRHMSFLETGRSMPSREMVLRLAERLQVPLRERNPMLEAAGFAPLYRTRPLDDPDLHPAMQSVRTVLAAHAPHPALALDRLYDVVAFNDAAEALLAAVLPQSTQEPLNVVRASLHPQGLAPHIVNFKAWRADLLSRLEQQVQRTGDADLAALCQEVSAYPVPDGQQSAPLQSAGLMPEVVLPLQLRVGQQVLSFITTLTVFGSPHDIVLQELAVETFFAADDVTARFLQDLASRPASHPGE